MSKSVTVATTRELLLDAAYDAALAGDWEHVRMADVARAAGVSRQTLYYEFGSKDELAEALALREAARWIAGAEAAVVGHEGSPSEAIAAGTAVDPRGGRAQPAAEGGADRRRRWPAALPDHPRRAAAGRGARPLRAAPADALARHRRRAASRLVADTVTRMQFSHLLLPGGRPEQVAHDIALLVDALLPEGQS